MKKSFKTTIAGRGPKSAWAFMPIPFDVAAVFGKKSRVAVAGTVNGFPFRSSIMPVGDGTHEMMFNKDLQAGANAVIGDEVLVVMQVDSAPRSVELPADLKARLDKSKALAERFAAIAYSHQKEFVRWIEEAKRPETREKRIAQSIEMIAANQVRK